MASKESKPTRGHWWAQSVARADSSPLVVTLGETGLCAAWPPATLHCCSTLWIRGQTEAKPQVWGKVSPEWHCKLGAQVYAKVSPEWHHKLGAGEGGRPLSRSWDHHWRPFLTPPSCLSIGEFLNSFSYFPNFSIL